MSHKPDVPEVGLSALPDHRIVALQGRDALAFAQAQAMNDVSALADGQWQWNGWLTPKGRVIALFALLRLDAETAWLLLPDADGTEIAAALQRFVFRSKLAISVRDDLQVSGAFRAPEAASGAQLAGNAETGVELDMGGAGGARVLRIAAPADTAPDAAANARWRAFDLRHGLPRLASQASQQWTPQQLSLQRLRAYSVKKGCYPGQEIVARTHFLGQAKRALALFETAARAQEGDPVTLDGAPFGNLACTADASPALALAVVPLEHADGAVRIGDQPATLAVLRDGLAR
jgi:folate-binding protein YgfZ